MVLLPYCLELDTILTDELGKLLLKIGAEVDMDREFQAGRGGAAIGDIQPDLVAAWVTLERGTDEV